MKIYSVLILLGLSVFVSAQINCGNGNTDSADVITVLYNGTSSETVHKVDFTASSEITETTGGLILWLRIPNTVSPAPSVVSVVGEVLENESFVGGEFSDSYYYYSFTKSNINPNSLFPAEDTVTIAEVEFNTSLGVGEVEIVLTSPLAEEAYYNGTSWTYYRTTLTVCSGNEDSYSLSANNILPIIMKSFTAKPFENRDAKLDWITSSEVNASHFEIERSDDGVNFAKIGRENATGNSSIDQVYSFTDTNVNTESVDLVKYYRIKMIDIDGEYKYSGIRVVNFTKSEIDFSITTYPNPAADFVQIILNGIDNTTTERPTLLIYNNDGKLLKSETLNSDLEKIDISDLQSSLYHFVIDYNESRYTERIVKMK